MNFLKDSVVHACPMAKLTYQSVNKHLKNTWDLRKTWMEFDRLANNAKIAGLVARYVMHYASKSGQPLEPSRKPWGSPNESVDPLTVRNVVSDFVANLAHYASVNSVAASDVITDAMRNFAEEISGDEGHGSRGKLDANLSRLKSLIEEIVFDATIGTVCDKRTGEAENDFNEQT